MYPGGVQATGGDDTVSGCGLAAVAFSYSAQPLWAALFSAVEGTLPGRAHIPGLPGGLGKLPGALPRALQASRAAVTASPHPGVALTPSPGHTHPPLCSPGPGMNYRLRLPLEARLSLGPAL